ncbi:hypothetical protein ASZ78_007015 [Callipepla squamata]|uniref:PHD-type domain-containing protein n=1 Tax=Callipepla squamata TaxID=9009 RepID=A0A226MSQ3_CALSU|nr:hypothetical protein ASZ78_007015 [Callipepla squamata]
MSGKKRKAPDSEQPEDNFLVGILGFSPHAIISKVKQAKQKVALQCPQPVLCSVQMRAVGCGALSLLLMGLLCSFQQCCVCGERGAAIACAESGCERSFHLPCAVDEDYVIQFFGEHKSYCWEHCPQQTVQAAPEDGTKCVICLEPVEDSASYHTLVCPACKHTWFHRGCIQKTILDGR